MLVLASLVAAAVFLRQDGINKWLDGSAWRRKFFFFGSSLIAGIWTFGIAWPDYKAISDGHADGKNTAILCALAIGLVATVLLQAIGFQLPDRWETKVADALKERDAANADYQLAKNEGFFHWLVGHCFLSVIGIKKTFVHDASKNLPPAQDAQRRLKNYREAAKPERQVVALIQVPYEVYWRLLTDRNPRASLRVAYFARSGPFLVLRHCWNGVDSKCVRQGVKEKKLSRDRFFELTNETRSLAVAAAKTGDIQIVPSAKAAHADLQHSFKYFQPTQANRIESIVAIPLGVSGDNGYHEHVVCIDTDFAGFFDQDQRKQLEFVKSNLEQRLLCELAMASLLNDGT
ncbi:MAG TPA: hypothetical protein VHX65_14325 [Pirellulales bacterium]|jgi:hypothetical protein|nr:hypothetical protein [Pirellulales bacterium]